MNDAEKKPKEPCGVLAVMTRSDGHVIATASDFNRSGYGGFKLWEAQRMRAKEAVMRNTVRAYCSEPLVEALNSYLMDQIAEAMQRKNHKITFHAVGYPDDVKCDIERY